MTQPQPPSDKPAHPSIWDEDYWNDVPPQVDDSHIPAAFANRHVPVPKSPWQDPSTASRLMFQILACASTDLSCVICHTIVILCC